MLLRTKRFYCHYSNMCRELKPRGKHQNVYFLVKRLKKKPTSLQHQVYNVLKYLINNLKCCVYFRTTYLYIIIFDKCIYKCKVFVVLQNNMLCNLKIFFKCIFVLTNFKQLDSRVRLTHFIKYYWYLPVINVVINNYGCWDDLIKCIHFINLCSENT